MAHSKSEIKKAKNLLNKFAPKGEQLAFINPKEANLLKRMGGAGKDVNVSGIKSYYYVCYIKSRRFCRQQTSVSY